MDANDIKILLNRFYEGQTTDQEEQQLKDYFFGADVDPQWTEEQCFFKKLYAETIIPNGLEWRLERQIDAWNKIDKTATRKAKKVRFVWVTGVAASLLLLFTIGWFVKNATDQHQYTQQQYTIDNPQDAYATTQKALVKFSDCINKGLNQVDHATND